MVDKIWAEVMYWAITSWQDNKNTLHYIQTLSLFPVDMAGSEELQDGRPRSWKSPRCLNYFLEESWHWHWILPEGEINLSSVEPSKCWDCLLWLITLITLVSYSIILTDIRCYKTQSIFLPFFLLSTDLFFPSCPSFLFLFQLPDLMTPVNVHLGDTRRNTWALFHLHFMNTLLQEPEYLNGIK